MRVAVAYAINLTSFTGVFSSISKSDINFSECQNAQIAQLSIAAHTYGLDRPLAGLICRDQATDSTLALLRHGLLQDGELDRQFVVYHRHVAHVFVLHHVLVVDEHLRVPRIPIAVIVVDVELLVVVAVVASRAAPRREGTHGCLRPRVVRVVERDRRHARPIQVERVEGVAEQVEVGRGRVTEACNENNGNKVTSVAPKLLNQVDRRNKTTWSVNLN